MKHNNEFLEALLEESVKIFPEDYESSYPKNIRH